MLHKDELRLREEPASDALRPIDAGEDSVLASGPAPAGVRNNANEAIGGKVVSATRPAPVAPGKTEPKPAGKATGPHARSSFVQSVLVPAIVALACGMAGAYVYENHVAALVKMGQPLVHEQATGHGASAAATAARAEKTSVPEPDALHELRSRLDQVSDRLTALRSRIDAIPKAESLPDHSSLQVRVAELSKAIDGIAPEIEKTNQDSLLLKNLCATVRTLRDDVTLLQNEVEKRVVTVSVGRPPVLSASSEPGSRRAADGPRVEVSSEAALQPRGNGRHDAARPALPGNTEALVPDEDLARGAELYLHGNYRAALDYFTKLELTNLDDARVWYYAALSNGFVTKDWNRGTVELVEKGIERERAGTPDAAKIDAAFKDLTSAAGKDWLTAFRKRVRGS